MESRCAHMRLPVSVCVCVYVALYGIPMCAQGFCEPKLVVNVKRQQQEQQQQRRVLNRCCKSQTGFVAI